MRRRARGGSATSGAVVICLAIGGCTAEPATDDSETTAAGSPTSETSTSGTATPPTTSVDESSTSQSATTSQTSAPTSTATPPARSAAARVRAAQIKATDLPGFNQEWAWDRHETLRGPGDQPPPVCSVTDLLSIGGRVAQRTNYASSLSKDAKAVQVTAVFPDEQTALTAEQVLVAWHDHCQRRVDKQGLENANVSAMSEVQTYVGLGQQWMTTYRPVPGQPDSAWFNAEGFVRSADMITYLVIRNAGQDYNYPRGQQPIDDALWVAGRYLRAQR